MNLHHKVLAIIDMLGKVVRARHNQLEQRSCSRCKMRGWNVLEKDQRRIYHIRAKQDHEEAS